MANLCEFWFTLTNINDGSLLNPNFVARRLGIYPDEVDISDLGESKYEINGFYKWSPPLVDLLKIFQELYKNNKEIKGILEWSEFMSAGAGVYEFTPLGYGEILYISPIETGPWEHIKYSNLKEHLELITEVFYT